MNRWSSFGAIAGAFLLASVVAACGGGGGGGNSALPSTPGSNSAPGGSSPTVPPINTTPTPVPSGQTPGPQLNGTMQLATGGSAPSFTYAAEAQGSSVVFSCGCTSQAGLDQLQAGGVFDIPQTAQATPAAPSPTYTSVPGRNYVIVATASNNSEAWQYLFLGSTPSHNLTLGASSSNVSDVYSAAGALYVYYESQNSADAFDDWNFNSVLAWVNHMRGSGGLNASETQLLNDIASAEEAGKTLFPAPPSWNTSQATNSTITSDLTNVAASGDTSLPTPCPGGTGTCTGTPSP
jgi:hypothetical protein